MLNLNVNIKFNENNAQAVILSAAKDHCRINMIICHDHREFKLILRCAQDDSFSAQDDSFSAQDDSFSAQDDSFSAQDDSFSAQDDSSSLGIIILGVTNEKLLCCLNSS